MSDSISNLLKKTCLNKPLVLKLHTFRTAENKAPHFSSDKNEVQQISRNSGSEPGFPNSKPSKKPFKGWSWDSVLSLKAVLFALFCLSCVSVFYLSSLGLVRCRQLWSFWSCKPSFSSRSVPEIWHVWHLSFVNWEGRACLQLCRGMEGSGEWKP